jgi:hypothetical protein
MPDLTPITVTITAGQSLSTPALLGIKTLVGISLPSTWTQPTGGCSFQVSVDGVNYQELYDSSTGTPITIAFAAALPSRFIVLSNTVQWAGVNALKVRSGSAASPVNQGSTVVITLLARTVAF